MTSSVAALHDYYSQVRHALRASSISRRSDVQVNRPKLTFQMASNTQGPAIATAYEFIVELSILSGLQPLPTYVAPSCAVIEVCMEHTGDTDGRDLLHAFQCDPNYRTFCSAFDVSKVTFRNFPESRDCTSLTVDLTDALGGSLARAAVTPERLYGSP